MSKPPPHFVDLIREALLKSFWRKNALVRFLRSMGVSNGYLSTFRQDEYKRSFLDRLFPELEKSAKGPAALNAIAQALADQTSFPDLTGWEDQDVKLQQANEAVDNLKTYMNKKKREKDAEDREEERRHEGKQAQAKVVRSQADLDKLKVRLEALYPQMGTQQAGYDFETWFYDLAEHFDVESRRPYKTAGRQVDGSITVEGTTYLVELKFQVGQADGPDIDSLLAKVNKKADNTMGIMLAMSGYSSVAISDASHARSPLLLIDYNHVYYILQGTATLPEVVTRIRRHSAQEGKAYLPVGEFGG